MEKKGIKRKGIILILSSPSGAGKTTIAKKILTSEQNISLSVSFTTRNKRDHEIEGKDYFFVGQEKFEQLIHQEDLLEYAKVYNHYYGTPKEIIENKLKDGFDMLFDIDWQGAQQLRQKNVLDVISIFILPPSLHELEARLYKRASDSPETVKQRMQEAHSEISHWREYDYVLINYDIEETTMQISHILNAERLRRERQLNLKNIVDEILL